MERIEMLKKALKVKIGKYPFQSKGLKGSRKEVMRIVWDTVSQIENEGYLISNNEFGILVKEAWKIWKEWDENTKI